MVWDRGEWGRRLSGLVKIQPRISPCSSIFHTMIHHFNLGQTQDKTRRETLLSLKGPRDRMYFQIIRQGERYLASRQPPSRCVALQRREMQEFSCPFPPQRPKQSTHFFCGWEWQWVGDRLVLLIHTGPGVMCSKQSEPDVTHIVL